MIATTGRLGIRQRETYATTCSEEPCGHKNGWYDKIDGFFVDKKVFVCTDCLRILDRKIKEKRSD